MFMIFINVKSININAYSEWKYTCHTCDYLTARDQILLKRVFFFKLMAQLLLMVWCGWTTRCSFVLMMKKVRVVMMMMWFSLLFFMYDALLLKVCEALTQLGLFCYTVVNVLNKFRNSYGVCQSGLLPWRLQEAETYDV